MRNPSFLTQLARFLSIAATFLPSRAPFLN